MVMEYKISEEEAINRISEFFQGDDLTPQDSLLYHDSPEHWAGTIYFEDRFWWKKDVKDLAPRKFSPNNSNDK